MSRFPVNHVRPGVTPSRLDADLIAELELEEHKSFDEIVRQIMGEVQTELALYKALEGYEDDYELTDSEGHGMEVEQDESGTGYETDQSRGEDEVVDQSENASKQESDTSTSHSGRAHIINSQN